MKYIRVLYQNFIPLFNILFNNELSILRYELLIIFLINHFDYASQFSLSITTNLFVFLETIIFHLNTRLRFIVARCRQSSPVGRKSRASDTYESSVVTAQPFTPLSGGSRGSDQFIGNMVRTNIQRHRIRRLSIPQTGAMLFRESEASRMLRHPRRARWMYRLLAVCTDSLCAQV